MRQLIQFSRYAVIKSDAFKNATVGVVAISKTEFLGCTKTRSFSTRIRDAKEGSYYHKVGNEPLQYITLGQMYERSASRWPDRKAVVSLEEKESLTYSELLQKADQLAAALAETGLKKGDRLGIWAPNCCMWLVVNLAANRAGFILVSINPQYSKTEFEHCINKVGVKALITMDRNGFRQYYSIIKELAPELDQHSPGSLRSKKLPTLRSLTIMSDNEHPGAFNYDDLANTASPSAIQKIASDLDFLRPDDPCDIQFTSGTTGNPKAVVHSHMNVVNSCILLNKRQGYQPGREKICVQLPFFHAFASVVVIAGGLQAGATLVLPSATYNSKTIYKALHSENCTYFHGTPTMYVDLLNEVNNSPVGAPPSLRNITIGGAATSPGFLKKIENDLKIEKAVVAFGMTENAASCCFMHANVTDERGYETVGQTVDHIEIKIIDQDGNTVPKGVPGELCLRGFSTMLGYWDDEKRTKEVLGADGWLKTGDKLVMLEDGYAVILGRIKDIIIRGGENIYPKEIEDLISMHENVLEAHAFGIPHDRLGEEICVAVRLKDGADLTTEDVKKFCEGKLAAFKIPRRVKVVTEFPKTLSGKIQKFKLTEMMVRGDL